MTTAVHLQTLTLLLLLHHTISTCIQTCSSPTSHITVPYPFGFSSSCIIPLDCASDGSTSIHHFPIRTLSADSIIVNLKAECSRSIHTFKSLFSSNYTLRLPTTPKCSLPPTPCKLPSTAVETNFEMYDCGGVNSTVSCYSENPTVTKFLSLEKVLGTKCEFLFSSISLDVQVVQIGWWIEGSCRCSVDADCIEVLSEVTNQTVFRCKCRKGFVGDGFVNGISCRRGELSDFSRIPIPYDTVEVLIITLFILF